MEPDGTLPYSQVPHTCLYPEPVQSSPYPHNQIPEDGKGFNRRTFCTAWDSIIISITTYEPGKILERCNEVSVRNLWKKAVQLLSVFSILFMINFV
jgi:hypothetical protein